MQFASWVAAIFYYYCNPRWVKRFRFTEGLIVSDKLYETLNAETKYHIDIIYIYKRWRMVQTTGIRKRVRFVLFHSTKRRKISTSSKSTTIKKIIRKRNNRSLKNRYVTIINHNNKTNKLVMCAAEHHILRESALNATRNFI